MTPSQLSPPPLSPTQTPIPSSPNSSPLRPSWPPEIHYPVLHDRHLYWINENQGIAYCADANTGKTLYEQRIPNADMIYASPIIADDRLYYITRTGRIFILAAKPAYQLLASIDLRNNGAFNASPAVASNRLYIRSDRFLFCFGKN